ncbi:MAG: guanylate kinase [Acidaminococcales bacterium]|jgi:guanylate kinase|nr:guanylate kinase [Acidaminococcales bacterium]
MKDKGVLLIVSGPSGAGKGTICSALLNKYQNIYYSVSLTTRAPRAGELNGREYFFVTEGEFKKMIAKDQLLEYAVVYGNYYGTPRKNILEQLEMGNDVLLEIEMDGAEQIRTKFNEGVFVFILPPSLEDLAARLKGRDKDDGASIKNRLEAAAGEIDRAVKYDYVIVNNTVEEALEKLYFILNAEKSRVARNLQMIADVCGRKK